MDHFSDMHFTFDYFYMSKGEMNAIKFETENDVCLIVVIVANFSIPDTRKVLIIT